jgi:LuxR family maltose regulon positive regulatory protein
MEMETLASPLVLTKLRVPAVRPRFVSRARLIDLLTPESGAGLVLVCAPAGYGKTTLLAEWAHSLGTDGTAVAWVALDPSDDDPILFTSYLIAGLIQVLGPIAELTQIAQLLRSSPEMDLRRILPSVINAIVSSDRECVLILDDYHLIGSPAVHDALAYLLTHLPGNLRIAVGSRSDPPLPLARMRARGQLLEIRTAGLRFTAEETAQFLNEVMQLELSAQGIAVLEERTEGWAAGLQLAALSVAGRGDKEDFIAAFSGSQRYLVEYLMEEVISRQPEELQPFLLLTSILERMCGALCDALRGEGAGSAEILKRLEQTNLFVVALDDRGDWYRYHHLFRDFLQVRLKKRQPEVLGSLHRAASEWLAGNDLLREAALHAFQTRDWEYAAAFVEQHNFTLIVHSEMSTLYEWCSAFPEEVMQRHPMLCLIQGLALAYGFRRQNRARVEARLRQADQLIAGMEDRGTAAGLIDFASVVRTFLAFAPDPAADPRELLALTRGAPAYPEGDPNAFTGLLTAGYAYLALHDAQAAGEAFEAARQIALAERLYFGIVESTFHLARLAHAQGLLRRSEELCRQGQADIAAMLAHPEQTLSALGSLDIALGCVLLEQDRLDEAEERLRRGLDLMGGGTNPHYLMTAYIALARLHEIKGRPEEMMRTLDRLEAAWPDVAFCTEGLRVQYALRTAPADPGALADADLWRRDFAASLGEVNFAPGMGPFGAAEVYYLASLAWVRAQIALGGSQEAMPYLARQLALAEAHGLAGRGIELSLLEAQAWRAEGEHGRARVSLERALAAAQPAGYLRIFDQGSALTGLLVEAAQCGIYTEYMERIIAALGLPEGAVPPGRGGPAERSARTPTGERLSERELEVLRLIAQGATNREIADRLVITVGTVKSHINHLLGKLECRNRTEAVVRARTLGLLEF